MGWTEIITYPEDLPEENKLVLCIKKSFGTYYQLASFRWLEGIEDPTWYDEYGDRIFPTITHWMPLPKMPNELKKDEMDIC